MYMTSDGTFRLPQPPRAARGITMGVQKHFTGSLVIGEQEGRVMEFESHTEKLTALVMVARPNVVNLENQVLFEWIKQNGEPARHFFDYRASFLDGTRLAVMVKNSRKAADPHFLAEMRLIASQVTPDFADAVSLVIEKHLDPIEVYNAELLHSVRHPDPETDAAVWGTVAGITGAVKIADIVAKAGCSGAGFQSVARMIRHRQLELTSHECIEPESLVRRRIV